MQYKNIVLTNTTIGSFMAVFDSNIVLISLPTIVRELGASTFDALWVIMGYTLILATILLTIGRLADIYGRIRLYNLGFAIFTIGSGLCSVSLSGLMLVLFRLVQGGGAALIFANNVAILTDAFPADERGRAIGINLVAGTAGSVTGLIAGGILTSLAGWRSIFWINIPIGIFATLWGFYRLKELSIPSRGEKLDPLGNSLFAAGLSLFLLGLTLGALTGWTLVELATMIVGIVLLGAFAYAETKVDNPMMDMKLFKNKAFSGGILSNFLAALARGAVSLVLVFYFQGPLQLDPLTAGILLIPFSFAFVAVGPISGHLSDRYGARGLSTTGLLVSFLAFAWFALLPIDVSYNVLLIPMVLAGAGGGMFVAPNIASIMNSVPVTRRGIASGMSSTLISAGVLLSLGVSFAILATSMPLATLQAIFAGKQVSSGQINLGLFSDAMHKIFALMAAISLIAVIPSSLRGPKAAEKVQSAQSNLIAAGAGEPD